MAGEARHDQAGWAYTITRPGNSQTHTPCHTIDEAYGSIATVPTILPTPDEGYRELKFVTPMMG